MYSESYAMLNINLKSGGMIIFTWTHNLECYCWIVTSEFKELPESGEIWAESWLSTETEEYRLLSSLDRKGDEE